MKKYILLCSLFAAVLLSPSVSNAQTEKDSSITYVKNKKTYIKTKAFGNGFVASGYETQMRYTKNRSLELVFYSYSKDGSRGVDSFSNSSTLFTYDKTAGKIRERTILIYKEKDNLFYVDGSDPSVADVLKRTAALLEKKQN